MSVSAPEDENDIPVPGRSQGSRGLTDVSAAERAVLLAVRFRAFRPGYSVTMQQKLGKYRRKRRFGTTSEPRGSDRRSQEGAPFVVQKHGASTLHYDLRIEVDEALKSWTVPKGPSLNPKDKRLAVPTEDHPLEYRDFEGVIPEGEYGSGTVLVWDTGTYDHLTDQQIDAGEAVQRGRINIWLEGEKLRGGYTLTRMG